jgi:hypothetical protein
MWGGWVLITGLVFSYMSGIIHPYYMVALAPGIAALVGIGAAALWQARLGLAGRITVAVAIVATAVWAYVLLDRTPDWLPWLRWVIVVTGVTASVSVLASSYLSRSEGPVGSSGSRRGRRALVLVPVGLALVAGLAGPTAYALDTVNSARTGAIVSAGPQTEGFGGGGGFPGGRAGQFGRGTATGGSGTAGSGTGSAGTGAPGGSAGSAGPAGSAGTRPGGSGASGSAGVLPGGSGSAGARPGGFGGRGGAGGFGGRGGAGGFGGLGGSTTVSSATEKLLEQDASSYKWVAATVGSEAAAPLELATGDAVMAIGGFNGTDPWPTLAVFEELVANHEIHYYVGQDSESFGGGRGSSTITKWVAAHFTKETVGGETVYNLTEPTS